MDIQVYFRKDWPTYEYKNAAQYEIMDERHLFVHWYVEDVLHLDIIPMDLVRRVHVKS